MTLDDFLSRLTHVKRTGAGYTARCPAHDDTSPSLWVKDGENGKISFECKAGHCSGDQVLAAMELTWADIYPDISHGSAAAGKPQIVAVYQYFTADGAYTYEVCRFEPGFKPGKKKDFRPRVKLADGHYRWGLAKGRYVQQHNGDWRAAKDSDDSTKTRDFDNVKMVLYRLPELVAAIAAKRRVFVVEGEKDADNLAKLGFAVTTNTGGAKKWLAGYSTLLSSARSVVILPDNDPPDKQGVCVGLEHAKQIHTQLPRSVIVELPGLPPKGDVSDWIAAGGSRDALIELATQAMANRDVAPPPLPPPVTDAPPQIDPDAPFRCVGYDRLDLFFQTSKDAQILRLQQPQLKHHSAALAHKNWWEANFGDGKGIDWVLAADQLRDKCRQVGLFNPQNIRGRGTWLDDDPSTGEERLIEHWGDRLIIDGQRTSVLNIQSKYIYERAHGISLPSTKPLSLEHGRRFVALCQRLRWEQRAFGPLFAGWIAVAPICGVLRWRPHIWVNGPIGSGKTWTLREFAHAALGPVVIRVQGSTTEAGIRQLIRADARPVLFDESEGNNKEGRKSIERTLELIRQSSSKDGGHTVKGTPTGQVIEYHIQSCFCLASSGVGLKYRADETRFTVLSLQSSDNDTQFPILRRDVEAFFAETKDASFVTRSCQLGKVIRRSAEIFADAYTATTKNRRHGDQLGALMAGYWSLISNDSVSPQEAEELAEAMPLEEILPPDETKDEDKCLNYLLEQRVRFDKPHSSTVELSIQELIDLVLNSNTADIVAAADATLRRYGLKANLNGLYVANQHSQLGKLFGGTQWENGWARILKRLPEAKATEAERFNGLRTRTVLLPIQATAAKQAPVEEEEALF